MAINPLAAELNRIILEESPTVYTLLSRLGREMYFPRGIVEQSADARQKAWRFNATIGIATHRRQAMFLPSMIRYINELGPDESLSYPPTKGVVQLRDRWLNHLREENPTLRDKHVSLPIVTSGITHGLSLVADLFCDEGDPVILPDLFWGNYRMIFGLRRGGRLMHYPFFNERGGLNLESLAEALSSLPPTQKAIIILNFPHNPTGYSPTPSEAEGLAEVIQGEAESGRDILVVCDDAYFGFFYEEGILRESMFSFLCDLHPRVLAVKLDGATKEDYAWGLRIGFLTHGIKKVEEGPELYSALNRKIGGAIRSSVSCCSMLAQNLLLKSISSPTYRQEKEELYRMLRDRYLKVKEMLASGRFNDAFTPYPFNSGYFMCLRLHGGDAEGLRRHLLEQEGVGIISLDQANVRIAFSCMETEEIPGLFDILYNAVMKTRREAL